MPSSRPRTGKAIVIDWFDMMETIIIKLMEN